MGAAIGLVMWFGVLSIVLGIMEICDNRKSKKK